MAIREVSGTGLKRGGKIEWDDQRGFSDEIKAMKDGSVIVTVMSATPKAVRTYKQLRYYFGHCLKLAAEETGHSKDELHDDMCRRFLSKTITYVNKQTGEVEEREVAGRTSDLTPDEMSQFTEKVRQFLGEFLGITTHDPDIEWRQKETAA